MKVLFVAPWVPTPRRPRSFGLLRALTSAHETHAIVVAWSKSEASEALNLPASKVTVVRLGRLPAVARVVRALFGKASLQQAYVDDPQLRMQIRATLAEFKPDTAYFNVIRSAHLVNEVAGVPAVLDMDERRSGYYEQLRSRSRQLHRRILGAVEAPRMRLAEKAAQEVFQQILVSSPLDTTTDHNGAVLVRSPHTLGSLRAPDYTNRDVDNIIFVGRMSYGANQEAVAWFVSRVLPGIRKRRPNVVFNIVGENPPWSIRRLDSSHVKVRGYVDNVSEHYGRASVSIVPVHLATGVQMKLIESLFTGTPTVASRLTAAQAGLADGTECLVASSPDEWVDQVTELLDHQDLARSLGARGQNWAANHYDPALIDQQLLDVITTNSD